MLSEPMVVPSILSADFACLRDQLEAVEKGGAGMVHVDVMDGHFVPNLTLGVPVVRSLSGATRLALDVHLMITDPARYAPAFISAGARLVSFHVETAGSGSEVARRIQAAGARAGLAINPDTPLSALEEAIGVVDYVLLMSVHPGFGGQEFIPATMERLTALRALLRSRKREIPIEVDGGIGESNAWQLARAGANWLVAGSAIFSTGDPEEQTRRLCDSLRRQVPS